MNESSLTPLQHSVLKILLRDTSEEKPMSAAALVYSTGVGAFGQAEQKKIEVASIVTELRFKGHPICSATTGFFYARKAESLKSFIKKLEKRIDPTLKLIAALNNCYANVGGPAEGHKLKVTLPVRTETGMMYQQFDVGEDGNPIVPPDVTLV